MDVYPKLSTKAFVVKSYASQFGIPTPFLGINPNILKLSSKDTGGKLSTFHYVGLQKVGPGLHTHLYQDEISYVIDGQYIFIVGQEKQLLQTGDMIFLPRNIPHTWVQISDHGELFFFLQPAGKMEEFFLMITDLAGKAVEPGSADVGSAYGIEDAGPGLNLTDAHLFSEKLSKGFVVCADGSRFGEITKWGGGNQIDNKVSGKDTSGELSIFEYVGIGKGGPPLHIHPNQDELFISCKVNTCFNT